MSRADFTRVLRVVIEVFLRQHAVFITNEAVAAHGGRIELHLDFDVFCDGDERAAHLLDQHLPRLAEAVDVGVVAIALVGQSFHGPILQVPTAKAQHAEKNAALRLLRDERLQCLRRTDPDVEVAVRAEDHAVHTFFDEPGHGLLVGELDARAAMRAASGLEFFDGSEDVGFLLAIRRRQHKAAAAGIDDHGHAVPFPELFGQHAQRLLHQRQLVRLVHRAGDIDEEDEVAVLALVAEFTPLDRDARQPMRRLPRAGRHLHPHREGFLRIMRRTFLRRGEIIHQLLNPHRIRRRNRVLVQEPPHIRIGRRIDINRERRKRLPRHILELVFEDAGVGLRVAAGVKLRAEGWHLFLIWTPTEVIDVRTWHLVLPVFVHPSQQLPTRMVSRRMEVLNALFLNSLYPPPGRRIVGIGAKHILILRDGRVVVADLGRTSGQEQSFSHSIRRSACRIRHHRRGRPAGHKVARDDGSRLRAGFCGDNRRGHQIDAVFLRHTQRHRRRSHRGEWEFIFSRHSSVNWLGTGFKRPEVTPNRPRRSATGRNNPANGYDGRSGRWRRRCEHPSTVQRDPSGVGDGATQSRGPSSLLIQPCAYTHNARPRRRHPLECNIARAKFQPSQSGHVTRFAH